MDVEDAGFGPEGAFAGMSTSAPAGDPRVSRNDVKSDVEVASSSVFGGSASVNAGTSRTEAALGTSSAEEASPGAPRPSNNNAVGVDAQATPKRRGWIFSLSYYQQFFDVDTEDVKKRIANVFTAPHRGDFLDAVDGNPDLYVPFWGCATLVFFTAIGSAWGKYSIHKSKGWDFDARTVSLSAVLVYGYVFIFSLICHLTLTCYAGVENLRVIDVWCLYGYSILAFVPVCILATVPVELFRWMFTGACAALSTLFLMSNIRKRVSASTKGKAFGISFVSFIGAAHFAFALLLKLFFFQYYYGE